jgi:hypothetical protein
MQVEAGIRREKFAIPTTCHALHGLEEILTNPTCTRKKTLKIYANRGGFGGFLPTPILDISPINHLI